MERREALKTVATIMGSAVFGAQGFLSGCSVTKEPDYIGILTVDDNEILMDEFAETILPATVQSPGAKDAEVGRFINVIVTECYDENEQQVFLDGINRLNEKSEEIYGRNFIKLKSKQRYELLLILEEELVFHQKNSIPSESKNQYYQMMKQLTLLGFLTSEVGITQVMRHAPIPGRFDPCVPCEDGEKAWA